MCIRDSRKAQAEAATRDLGKKQRAETLANPASRQNTTEDSMPPSAQSPKATPPKATPPPESTLPKIHLLAKSEIPTTTPRPPAPQSSQSLPSTAKPQTAPPIGGGTVAGSYVLPENANALRDHFRNQNVRVAVERVTVNGRLMYQVRIWR